MQADRRLRRQRWVEGFLVAFAAATLGVASPARAVEESGTPSINVLTGTVVDHEGKPVADAKVVACHAREGYMWYQSPEEVFCFASEKRFLLFFTRVNGKRSDETKTAEDGSFHLRSLAEGSYQVLAVHPERGITLLPRVEQPNEEAPLRIELERPAFVEGQLPTLPAQRGKGKAADRGEGNDEKVEQAAEVRGKEEQTVGSGESALTVEDMPWRRTAELRVAEDREFYDPTTDDSAFAMVMNPRANLKLDGSFRVGPVPGGKKWVLTISEYAMEHQYTATLLKKPLTLADGETHRLGLLGKEGAKVTGKVIGPEGKPLSEVMVGLAPQTTKKKYDPAVTGEAQLINSTGVNDAANDTFYGALTNKSGEFTVAGLPPGPYAMTAQRWAVRTAPG
jgi:protocatechuate 3,4-dioxygenase beta subunit